MVNGYENDDDEGDIDDSFVFLHKVATLAPLSGTALTNPTGGVKNTHKIAFLCNLPHQNTLC